MRNGLGIGLIALFVVLAACGGDEGGDDGGGAGTTPPASGGTGGATAGTTGGAGMGGDACVTGFTTQGQTAACATCACSMCATEVAALEALMPAQRTLADAVLECARMNACSGTACYCGAQDTTACATAMPAMGPCVTEIEAAAGAMGLIGIASPASMPTTALGAATTLGRCLTGDTGMMMAGKCPACASGGG